MPFQPGVSGNPGGRRKEKLWHHAIKKAVLETDPLSTDGRLRLDALAQALVAAGLAGDVAAMREVGDRIDGKVPQALVGDEDEPPIAVGVIDLRAVYPKAEGEQ